VLQRQEEKTASFTAAVVERGGAKLALHTGVEAGAVQADLQGARWSVAGVKEQERQRHPDAPFTTSTLQQEASRKLGFSPRQTMAVAQQLYEGIAPFGGLITYMRTDSVNIAQEAQQRAREYIRTKLEKGMLPDQPRTYRTRSKLAQRRTKRSVQPTSSTSPKPSRPPRRSFRATSSGFTT
jgi:DNA topoisomerase-1